MDNLVLFDPTVALVELVGAHLESELGCDVVGVADAGALHRLAAPGRRPSPDLLVAESDGPGGSSDGLEAILSFGRTHVETATVLYTGTVDRLRLSVAWEAVRPASAVSKRSPLRTLDQTLRAVLARGTCPADPLLDLGGPPLTRRAGADAYRDLVPHRGHAKLWLALFELDTPPSYRSLAEHTGLAVNTLRNYRDDLLAELAHWGLLQPSMREMHEFALIVRPLLWPLVERRLGAHSGEASGRSP